MVIILYSEAYKGCCKEKQEQEAPFASGRSGRGESGSTKGAVTSHYPGRDLSLLWLRGAGEHTACCSPQEAFCVSTCRTGPLPLPNLCVHLSGPGLFT